MSKDKDFDYVLGKLPRKDRDGNDTTGDKIGKGGRHREDGTYSSVVYDIEVVDNDHNAPETNPRPKAVVHREIVETEKTPARYEDLPWWGQLLADITEDILYDLKGRALDSFEAWLKKRLRQKAIDQSKRQDLTIKQFTSNNRMPKMKVEQNHKPREINTEISTVKQASTVVPPDELDLAFERFSFNMTQEEAQKELLDAFILRLISAQKIWKVAHANIIDNEGKITDSRAMIEKFCAPNLIGSINAILVHNPTLLDEWQSVVLSSILGRELILDSKYIQIDEKVLLNRLMGIQEKYTSEGSL